MRLVMVVFTALSLGACHVEGPGAGEAKFKPDAPESEKIVGVVWAGADKEGYDDQLFGFSFDAQNKKISVRAIRHGGASVGYEPLGGDNDCVDHYEGARKSPSGDVNIINLSKRKGGKSIGISMFVEDDHSNLMLFEYEVLDTNGNPVTFTFIPEKHIPESLGGAADFVIDKLLHGDDVKDCDHVSQSGGEEGSVAPGGG